MHIGRCAGVRVCKYVGLHVCMYVCMYVCMHVCLYVRLFACMYVADVHALCKCTHTHTHTLSLSLSSCFRGATNSILAKSETLKLCLEGRQHSVVGHNLGRTSRAYLAELKNGAVCQVSQLGQARFGQPTPPSQRAKALTRDPPTMQRITSYLQGFRGRTLVLILQTTDCMA